MFFEHSQGGWLDHFPGQPVPILDTTSCEEISLNIQSKPLWCNLRPFVVVLSPTSRGYSFPFLSPKPPFLQTEHPHLSQPLLIHHVPQTLPQLQNLFSKAKGPKFNTEFEVSKPINTTEIPQPLCTQRGIFSSWCTHSWGCSSASVHPSCSLLCQTPSPPSIRPHQVFNDHTHWQWREQISPSTDSKIPCMKQSHKELSTFAGLEFVICHFLYYGNAPHLC